MKSPKISEGKCKELKNRLDEYIRTCGKRIHYSEVRYVMLRVVCDMEQQPFTTKQLAEAAEREHISRSTVYNVIQFFVKARILQVVNRDTTREHAMYEVLVGKSSHIELKCIRCGRHQRLAIKPIMNVIKEHKFNNFEMHRFSLYIYGECRSCRSNKRLE